MRDKSKKQEQKRILIMTIGEVFRQFEEEYVDLVIAKSKLT